MAVELGVAYLSILPSTDKLAAGIRSALRDSEDDADTSGKESGKRFGGGFKSMVGNALKGGVLAGLAGGTFLGGLGIKTAAEMEQADIAFTTMLGSAEKAEKFIGDLSAFAAKTPFDFPGLQTAATSLISAGIATRDVLPIMETLGDVTSGMGTGAEGIQRATVALQQMNAAGKVTGEDLNQLRDAGIPVFDLLSASMGKTKAEVAAMAQAGTLGAEGLNAIMNGLKSGKGLEKFSGLMEKQSASLTGMWSTFKDTLGMGLSQAVTPLIPLLKDGLGGAAKALPPILEGLASALANVIEFSIDAVHWGKEHKTTMTIVGTAAASLLAGLIAFKVVTGVTAAIKGLRLAFIGLNTAMVANPVGLIIAAIVALGVALFIAWKKSETFRSIVLGAFDKVKAAGSAIANFFTEKIPAAFNKVKSAAGSALGWVKSNWPKILAFLTGPIGIAVLLITRHWGKIKAGAGAAKDWIVGKFNALVGFVKGIPGKISGAASGMFDGVKNAARSAFNAVANFWNSTVGAIDFKAPDWVPGMGGKGFSVPNIPMLASGGILTRPTLNIAGEAGPEAVIPLDRLDNMLSRAATSGANRDARTYSRATPSAATARRTEFVITNWKTGEGFFREIAEDAINDADDFDGTHGRMR